MNDCQSCDRKTSKGAFLGLVTGLLVYHAVTKRKQIQSWFNRVTAGGDATKKEHLDDDIRELDNPFQQHDHSSSRSGSSRKSPIPDSSSRRNSASSKLHSSPSSIITTTTGLTGLNANTNANALDLGVPTPNSNTPATMFNEMYTINRDVTVPKNTYIGSRPSNSDWEDALRKEN